jgi:ferredoxin
MLPGELERLQLEARALEERLTVVRAQIESVEAFPERVVARVDERECTRCGICATVCPTEAIVIDEVAVIDPSRCTGCGACEQQCPCRAIHLVADDYAA